MPPDRDAAYLWDMLEYARQAQQIVSGLTVEQYQADELRKLATERVLEIIGEAARKVSQEFKTGHPEIPWQPIIAQRVVLAHLYGTIDHAKLWDVATVKIPELVLLLEPLIPPLPPNDQEQ